MPGIKLEFLDKHRRDEFNENMVFGSFLGGLHRLSDREAEHPLFNRGAAMEMGRYEKIKQADLFEFDSTTRTIKKVPLTIDTEHR